MLEADARVLHPLSQSNRPGVPSRADLRICDSHGDDGGVWIIKEDHAALLICSAP